MPAAFPLLKTGAVVQYPATKTTQYSSFVIRFMDGSDQRYRQYTPALQQWNIKLNLLDEGELHALEQFFMSQEGGFGTFTFVDPWTQTVYPNCSFEQDTLPYQLTDTSQGTLSVVVVENRT
ncbi:MAG TPA: DUF2460 domain-containing protein [Bryobacteraceae bacterium]|nr:DUF2460 domain-containing protein [Bryobacteraceae bacterium]